MFKSCIWQHNYCLNNRDVNYKMHSVKTLGNLSSECGIQSHMRSFKKIFIILV